MMKLGITYLYTISTYGYPPRIEDDYKAIADYEAMGFRYLEMEALGPRHAKDVWVHRAELRKRLDAHGVQVHNFCAVDPDLVSIDGNTRDAAVERFKRTCELGVYLGTDTLHLASYAPPVEYTTGRPYALGEAYAIPGKTKVRIPDGFDWNDVWAALVDSSRRCAEIAADFGKTVIMEPRVGEVICTSDSLLRLIRDVGMDNFKANFDTGHFSAARENIPICLMKMAGQFANIHISDNDLATPTHLTVGEGVIDWHEFFRILKTMNYKGYLGLDLGESETLVDDLKRSIEYIKSVCKEVGVEIEV